MNSAILFLIFNRPDTTLRVFEAIRAAKPTRLYIAADGPRNLHLGENELCEKARRVAHEVDWPCVVKTLFRAENLGCGKAVSGAIAWFFEQEDEGIILEDDCLPHPEFFPYCEELLERYRREPKVMFIGGTNFQGQREQGQESYYFSAYSHVWGWAAWKRTFQHYEFDMAKLDATDCEKAIRFYFSRKPTRGYWMNIFQRVRKKLIDTWDYQLTFSIWRAGGLSIIPSVNLISNIGTLGSHTSKEDQSNFNAATTSILPLRHPTIVSRNVKADAQFFVEKILPGLSFKKRAAQFLQKAKRLLFLKRARPYGL